MQVTEIALSLTGNPGLSAHNPLQRHYRDALCSRVHTPQSDLVLTGLGKGRPRRWVGPGQDGPTSIRRSSPGRSVTTRPE